MQVQVVTDRATLKPRIEKVEQLIESVSVSPTGKRAVFEARGEVFSVPAEHGPVVNLTRSSGIAERSTRAGLPDGKTVAYWTDRGGEYQLATRPGRRGGPGTGADNARRRLPLRAVTGRLTGRRLAFIDQAMRVYVYRLRHEAGEERSTRARRGSRRAASPASVSAGRPTRAGSSTLARPTRGTRPSSSSTRGPPSCTR